MSKRCSYLCRCPTHHLPGAVVPFSLAVEPYRVSEGWGLDFILLRQTWTKEETVIGSLACIHTFYNWAVKRWWKTNCRICIKNRLILKMLETNKNIHKTISCYKRGRIKMSEKNWLLCFRASFKVERHTQTHKLFLVVWAVWFFKLVKPLLRSVKGFWIYW